MTHGRVDAVSLSANTLFVLFSLFAAGSFSSNLATCLDGRYPVLCDKTQLSAAQREEVTAAEHRANFAVCKDGRYPVLCRHADLTSNEAVVVKRAEDSANLTSCLDGRYPALCRHGDLNSEEATRVKNAEHAANFSTCIDGRYPALCQHGDLTKDESQRVKEAEASAPHSAQKANTVVKRRAGSSCESGHWIESVMDDGSLVKLEDGTVWEVDAADTVDSALRGGSGILDRSVSGMTAIFFNDSRSIFDETTPTKPLAGIQGQSGFGSFERREDLGAACCAS